MEKHTKPDALDHALTDLYRADVPEDYRVGWRAAVKREEQTQMKKLPLHKKMLWRVVLPIAAALVLVFGAITAGNLIPTVVNDTFYSQPAPLPDAKKGTDNNQYAADNTAMESFATTAAYGNADLSAAPPMSEASRSSVAGGASNDTAASTTADTAATSGSKIVRTADLTVATTAFDADSDALTQLTQQLGGYIASVSVSGEASSRMDRVSYYSLRIPSDKLDAFLTGLSGVGRITYRYENSTDYTTQYSDTTMRLKTQQDKMTRLQELMKQATDVSDLLEIESEIADTQYEIDSLQSSLLTIDRDVDKSAVTVTLQEQSASDTAQTVELTLWQRLVSGFKASIAGLGVFGQNLLVFLAILLPALVPIAILLALILWMIRLRRKHKLTGKPQDHAEVFEAATDTQSDKPIESTDTKPTEPTEKK